jgi:hypothetical protein
MELPRVTSPNAFHILIRITISSPEDTILRIQYLSEKFDDQWSAHLDAHLVKGRNIVYLGIFNIDFSGRLRLRPGQKPGTYILHNIEVRSAS